MAKSLVILMSCAMALLTLGTEEVRGANSDKKAVATIKEQAASVEVVPAFTAAGADIQQEWLSIARVAAQYGHFTEKEVLSTYRVQTKEERAEGQFLQVVSKDTDGTEIQFDFDRYQKCLVGVRVIKMDGAAVSVAFAKYFEPERLGVAHGYISRARDNYIFEMDFDSRLTSPKIAWIYGTVPGSVNVQGRVLLWGEEGSVLVDSIALLSGDPLRTEEEKANAIQAARIEAGIASNGSRLKISPAYKASDRQLQRGMENIIEWSDKIRHVDPDQLLGVLRGDGLEQGEQEGNAVYIVKRQESKLWTVTYDKRVGKPKRAIYNDGNLAIRFGYEVESQFLSGIVAVSEIGKEDIYWLLSFYPTTYAPRMAVAAVGTPAIDPDAVGLRHAWYPPSDLKAKGKLQVWNLEGSPILDKEISSATAIESLLAELEMAFTSDNRSEIAWRGQEEEKKLLLGLD